MNGFRLSGFWSWPMRTTSEPLEEAPLGAGLELGRREGRRRAGARNGLGDGADRHERDDGGDEQASAPRREVQRHARAPLVGGQDTLRGEQRAGERDARSWRCLLEAQASHLPGGAWATRSLRRRRVVSSSVKVGGL